MPPADWHSLIVLDSLTGNLISRYDDVRGDIRCSASFDKETERFYFTSKGGDFCSAKIDSDGTIEEVKKLDMGSSSTSTPVICNKRAYVGVKGKEQFGVNSGHHIAVVNLDDMSVAYNLSTRGYPQTSGLATTGYESEDGYTYVYFIDNYEPGKIRVLKDKPGQTKAIITRDSEYEDENDYNVLFSPKGAQANYAICSLISDDYGTMYFKNDSAYMMALGSKITKIQVTKQPDKQEMLLDTATIKAAVAGEKWAKDKVIEHYTPMIDELAVDEDMKQHLILKLLEELPHFPMGQA